MTVFAVLGDATVDLAREQVDGYTIVRVPMLTRPSGRTPHACGAAPRSGRSDRRRDRRMRPFVATRPMLGGSLHFR